MRSFITQFLDGERVIMVERGSSQAHQAMVELGTPVCDTLAQTHEEPTKQRRFIIDLAAQKDLAVVAAATHPSAAGSAKPSRRCRATRACWRRCNCWPSACSSSACTCTSASRIAFAIGAMNVVRYMLPTYLR